MTSRHYSERTSRTEPRRSTTRRGIKKRGLLPSFGDIILPVVSVAAVALLIIAGRQFFLNGLKTSPGISSTRAFAEAPALIAERERQAELEARTQAPEPEINTQEKEPESEAANLAASETNLLAVPGVNETSAPLAQDNQNQEKKPVVTVTSTPVQEKTQAPAPAQAKTPAAPAKTQVKTPPAKPVNSNLPANKQWRVQVGAYGSKAGAQEAANKINKAGYKASIYSNPASKYIKVWVLGGADKKSAEQVMNSMKAMGFKTSFVFPPAK